MFIAQNVLAFFTGSHRIIAAAIFYEGAVGDRTMLKNAGLDLAIPERCEESGSRTHPYTHTSPPAVSRPRLRRVARLLSPHAHFGTCERACRYYVLFDAAVNTTSRVLAPYPKTRYHLK